jgi:hypothetical protein
MFGVRQGILMAALAFTEGARDGSGTWRIAAF